MTTTAVSHSTLRRAQTNEPVELTRTCTGSSRSSESPPAASWPERHIIIDPRFLRPAEVEPLIGDSAKAREKLGWEPRTSFEELIRLIIDADLELLARGVPQKQAG